jgi:hypothetical protein
VFLRSPHAHAEIVTIDKAEGAGEPRLHSSLYRRGRDRRQTQRRAVRLGYSFPRTIRRL